MLSIESIPRRSVALLALALGAGCAAASRGGRAVADGETDKEKLAKQLSNPIAALISVPIQANWDANLGPDDDGERLQVNVQPVIPISLTDDWNVISRTIVPVIWQDDVVAGTDQFGVGDIVQSAFFSPVAPSERGWIWGVGPVALLPTGSDEVLTSEKWGAGPTGVALKQEGPWTYGALANHLWSFAGDADRKDVNATYLQPFFAYTTRTATTFVLNSESTYDWEDEEWSIPINAMIAQMVKLGGQPVQFQVGARRWADSPDGGPEGWGGRFAITFLFPK